MDAVELEVYVDDGCLVCDRAKTLAAEVQSAFPELRVTVLPVERVQGPHRDLVAAVPTYVLNGRVVSLGNPRFGDLATAIDEVATGVRGR